MARRQRHLVAALLVISLILLGLPAPQSLAATPGEPQFTDLAGHWAATSILEASQRGIVTGYPDGTFRPSAPLTRAAFLTMLARAMRLVVDPVSPIPFSDSREHWVGRDGWLGAALSAGIIIPTDYPDGRFGPDTEITREEIAVMVARAVGDPLHLRDRPEVPLADLASVTPERVPYVKQAARLGLVTGYPDATFRPMAKATRAEAVVIALRVVNTLPGQPGPTAPAQPGPGPAQPPAPGPAQPPGPMVPQRPPVQITPAPDKLTTWHLGDIAISTFSPVTWVAGLDLRLNLFFTLENKGSSPASIRFDSLDYLRGPEKPTWLSAVLGYTDLYRGAITLAPGETETFELILSMMFESNEIRQTVPFTFKLLETGEKVSIPLEFVIKPEGRLSDLNRTAVLSGRVLDSNGLPVSGATVTVYYIHGENNLRAVTDANGRYRIDLPPSSDLTTLLGPRPQPHDSTGYTVLVDAPGYAAWSKHDLSAVAGEQVTLDARLQPAKAKASYRLVAELVTDGAYGYWWSKHLGTSDLAVSVQGQHPPRLDQPGHILGIDMAGKERWRIPTGNECWALDTSPDAKLVAAGCHDGTVYVVAADGTLLWKKALGAGMFTEIYAVRFSPDSTLLLVDRGPKGESMGVYQARSGELVWAPEGPVGQVRAARWSADGKRLVTAHSDGDVRMWSQTGEQLWQSWIGEVPFQLEIDPAYNVYGGGKTQYITSLDGATGEVRWRRYMDTTPNEAVRHLTATGDLLMVDSFNGILHALDPRTGETIWERQLPALADGPHGTGHNAFDMTPDGSFMVVGTRRYQLLVYDRSGALLWSHQASQRPDFKGDPASHGHYTGALSAAISPDGRYIVAGYADSVIRIFERE